ncbi:MAG: benzoate-CoA ligase family protein, partial [Xanthobacteraceae bacterium]
MTTATTSASETDAAGAAVGALPRDYNFAADILAMNLNAGRAGKPAYIDHRGTWTYGQLADRVERFGMAMRALGIRREERVLMCMLDTIDWPTTFLGCLKAGIVPIPVNTLLTEADYKFMLADSRARVLIVSEALYPKFAGLIGGAPELDKVIVSGDNAQGHLRFEDLIEGAKGEPYTAPTTCDDMAFWLYTSGSTGNPKGAVHVHGSLKLTADLYGTPVAGLKEDDLVYSVAKLFFAYGLGNAMTFPMAVGATTVLLADRPTPDGVAALLKKYPITVLWGVPTFYGAFLASPAAPQKSEVKLRRALSAGEALPEEIARRFKDRYGVEVSDGLGTTEMLHIYLTNSPGATKYGTTGRAVPGYEIKLVGEDGQTVPRGEMGELYVRGPT